MTWASPPRYALVSVGPRGRRRHAYPPCHAGQPWHSRGVPQVAFLGVVRLALAYPRHSRAGKGMEGRAYRHTSPLGPQ